MQSNVPHSHPATVDTGRIRVGAGIRIRPPVAASTSVSDTGRIRVGAGIRIRAGKSA